MSHNRPMPLVVHGDDAHRPTINGVEDVDRVLHSEDAVDPVLLQNLAD
jgi:hypothetical protein